MVIVSLYYASFKNISQLLWSWSNEPKKLKKSLCVFFIRELKSSALYDMPVTEQGWAVLTFHVHTQRSISLLLTQCRWLLVRSETKKSIYTVGIHSATDALHLDRSGGKFNNKENLNDSCTICSYLLQNMKKPTYTNQTDLQVKSKTL